MIFFYHYIKFVLKSLRINISGILILLFYFRFFSRDGHEMSVEAEHGGCWDSCVRLMCHNHSSSQPSNHRYPYPARHLYANGNKIALNGHIKG